MDYSGFKKTSEDDHKAVMTHSNGHTIHINKSTLSQAMRKQLASLPLHQAEPEGPVSALGDNTDSLIPGQVMSPQAAGPFGVVNDLTGPVTAQFIRNKEDLLASQPPPAPEPALAAPAPAPVDPNAAVNAMPGGADLAQANAQNTQALSQQANKDAALQHANAVHEEAAYNQIKRDLSDKSTEIEAATEDIRKSHINPKHYLESMGAGTKIATAIGLLLGGVGGGQTGQANPALAFLNKQIDNDLEAQKANLSSKHSLLSALHQQYGDKVVADNMFRAIRANTLSSQVAEAAAKSQSQQAKAAGLMFSGQLKQKAGEYMKIASLNGLRTSLEADKNPQSMDVKANAYLQAARRLDPKSAEEFEKRYIPSVGVASVPLDGKDREFVQKNQDIKDLTNRAAQILKKSKGFGFSPGSAEHAEAKNIQEQLQIRMGEVANLNRLTGEENKVYHSLVPDLAGTHYTGRDAAKLKTIVDSIDAATNSFYKTKGIHREAGDADMVTVINPKGQSGTIPKAQLQQALKQGYKKAD